MIDESQLRLKGGLMAHNRVIVPLHLYVSIELFLIWVPGHVLENEWGVLLPWRGIVSCKSAMKGDGRGGIGWMMPSPGWRDRRREGGFDFFLGGGREREGGVVMDVRD